MRNALGQFVTSDPWPRFWAKVEKTETCWLWTASTIRDGYGLFNPSPGKRAVAHRWILEQTGTEIPAGYVVMHTCDTPACVNPAHLRVGTQSENIRDAVEKGRHVCANASITAEQAAVIKARLRSGERPPEIARDIGCSVNVVYGIRYGRTWKKVRPSTMND